MLNHGQMKKELERGAFKSLFDTSQIPGRGREGCTLGFYQTALDYMAAIYQVSTQCLSEGVAWL